MKAGLNESSFTALPKVELHRHLEGSLRLDTIQEVAGSLAIPLPSDRAALSRLVQVQPDEPFTFQNFLAKFTTLRLLYRSPEIIRRVTREAVEDASADQVRYLELRFTPVALGRAESFPLAEVIDWVCESAAEASHDFKIKVGLIASVNRHEPVELAEKVARLAAEHRAQGLLGLDLAGNEAEFPAQPFLGLFQEAHQAGLKLTVHAGEWAGSANVLEALEVLQAERIGHGVRVLEDPRAVALAHERATAFEVCLTSNHQTGVVPSPSAHPLRRMQSAGLNVILATDDPAISRITLSEEYRHAHDDLGLPFGQLKEQALAAAQAAFLPELERLALTAALRQELES